MRGLLQHITILVVMLLTFFCPVRANELRIVHNPITLTVREPSWLVNRPTYGLGFRYKAVLISYSTLDSEALDSLGDRLTLDISDPNAPITPYIRLEADHFRRSDQGGYSIAGGTEIVVYKLLKARIGYQTGWSTSSWAPTYELVMEVKL